MTLRDVPDYPELSGYKIRGKGLFWQNEQPFPYYFAYIEGIQHYTFDLGLTWATKKLAALHKANLLN